MFLFVHHIFCCLKLGERSPATSSITTNVLSSTTLTNAQPIITSLIKTNEPSPPDLTSNSHDFNHQTNDDEDENDNDTDLINTVNSEIPNRLVTD